ncbi:MAG TPA: beta-galactosidase [Pilimelia sp.]|nr:beta-galactosidase [Pilimelia sp.]
MRPIAIALVATVALAGSGAAAPAAAPAPAGVLPAAAAAPQTVTFDGYSFLIGGQRTYFWSGEFHYFRLPSPDLWRDILVKMKAAGFNATSLYFSWAYHTPRRGVYDFTGVRDVDRLLSIATEVGIYVMARPGPYINAEVDGGGFPAWLTTQAGRARSNAADYRAAADEWLSRINPIIARHQITNGGGTVVSYQVENEFYDTSAQADQYMEHLKQRARADGITVPLTGNHNNNFISGTGGLDVDSPDSYPQGFNCSNPTSWRPTQSYAWARYAGHPLRIAEFQGGAFDPWGGPGYDRCRQLTGPEFQKVFYKDNIAQGVTEQNFYMAYGGTSWGWQPDPQQVYSSYDYGAAITEGRQLGAKYDEDKRIGYFTQSVAPLAKTDPRAAAPLSSSAIRDTARINPDTGTQFHVLRHTDSTSTATDSTTMSLDLGAAGSYPRVPFQTGTAITLAGRDSKIIVANYRLGAQQLQYSTSEIMTHATIGDRDVALLYGRTGQAGETMLRYANQPTVTVLSGTVSSTYNAATDDLRLNYTHGGLARVLITGGARPLLLLLGTDETAATFWRQDTAAGPVLVRGSQLLRTAAANGTTLNLTGDVAAAGDLEVFSTAAAVTWNGAALGTTTTASGSRQGALAAPQAVTLPALNTWRYATESPEAQLAFDDAGWTVANRATSNSTTTPVTRPVLFADDYGYHYGSVWYRGHFTGNAAQTGINLSAITGRAGIWSAWLNGRFLGSVAPTGSGASSQRTFTFPAGTVRQGADNVVSVLVNNQGHNEDYNYNDTHKQARGLTGAALTGSTANPVTWRIQGQAGGEMLADTVRGPMNAGGLYGERSGWHLPGFPDTAWQTVSTPHSSTTPGVVWYRTSVNLNTPAGQDTSLGIRIDDPSSKQYRAQIFVNGWHMGRYINNIGPQHSFPIPAGILRHTGANTIAIAVWNADASTGGLGTVRLESYGSPTSPLIVGDVPSPGHTPGPTDPTTTPVSSLPFQSATNGWGPVERNTSNGEAAAGDGRPITLNGTVYASGLGVHAASDVAVSLGGRCTRFTATAGVDDEAGNSGSVTFTVLADGVARYTSPTVTGSAAPLPVSVDVTGAQVLRLVVGDGGNGIGLDHADWADARVTCSS